MITYIIVAAVVGLIVGFFGGHAVGYANGLEDGKLTLTAGKIITAVKKLKVVSAKASPKPVLARKAPVKAKAAKKRR